MGKRPVFGLLGLAWAGIALAMVTGCGQCCRNCVTKPTGPAGVRPTPLPDSPPMIGKGPAPTKDFETKTPDTSFQRVSGTATPANNVAPGSFTATPHTNIAPPSTVANLKPPHTDNLGMPPPPVPRDTFSGKPQPVSRTTAPPPNTLPPQPVGQPLPPLSTPFTGSATTSPQPLPTSTLGTTTAPPPPPNPLDSDTLPLGPPLPSDYPPPVPGLGSAPPPRK